MPKQTSLRGIRIRLENVETDASFVFPFFDTLFNVRFLLIVTNEEHFLLHEMPLKEGGVLIASGRRMEPLAEAQPDSFHRYLHFDPWWTMRDVTSISSAVRQAVMASNVAARRHNHLVIRDVDFSDNLDRVEKLRVGDGVFRANAYSQAMHMPWPMQEDFLGRHHDVELQEADE